MPCPGRRLEPAHRRERQPQRLGPADDGLADGMLGALLDRGGQGEQRLRRLAGGGHDVAHRGAAHGERAGLVEDHGVHAVERLQRRRAADEHPSLGPAPGRHHDGRRRGEPHGARTGDDEDGHRVRQSQEDAGGGSEQPPGGEGQRRDDEDGRHEHRRHAVGQTLDRRSRALGFFHQLDDPGERGLRADPGGAEHEGARAVHGARRRPRTRVPCPREGSRR